jgi:hypothetical protein
MEEKATKGANRQRDNTQQIEEYITNSKLPSTFFFFKFLHLAMMAGWLPSNSERANNPAVTTKYHQLEDSELR